MSSNVNFACVEQTVVSQQISRLHKHNTAAIANPAPANPGAEGCTKNVPDALQIQ
jgi:hypothetical protein